MAFGGTAGRSGWGANMGVGASERQSVVSRQECAAWAGENVSTDERKRGRSFRFAPVGLLVSGRLDYAQPVKKAVM